VLFRGTVYYAVEEIFVTVEYVDKNLKVSIKKLFRCCFVGFLLF